MSSVRELANKLLEAGVHFGHQTRKWNPKMKRFIFGHKSGVHIIDLEKTSKKLEEAVHFAQKVASTGGKILFIGTKPQAREIVREFAEKSGMPFVNHRWLGGLLTNFNTIRRSVSRYLELNNMLTDGTLDKITKKEGSLLRKEIVKLERNLSGVVEMEKLPQALFVVDARRELISIKEADRLGIPVIAMVDTDSNPDWVKYPIPANDDALRSIRLITQTIADAILEGRGQRKSGESEELAAKAAVSAH